MQYRNTSMRYGLVAQFFHWLIVALIITQFVLAEIFEDMPLGLEKIAMIVRHKEIGMTVLLLAILRLIWRYFNTTPVLPDTLKTYERRLAHLTHTLLYLLIFAIPVSGWIMSSLAKIPVDYFGLFVFPDLVSPDKSLVDTSKVVHELLTKALLIVVGLHVIAALKHHFFLKDDVLKRMLPFHKPD